MAKWLDNPSVYTITQKRIQRVCFNYRTTALKSHASKAILHVILERFKVRLLLELSKEISNLSYPGDTTLFANNEKERMELLQRVKKASQEQIKDKDNEHRPTKK